MQNLQEAMEQMTTERDYNKGDLRALIRGANVVYSNAEIRNLTEFKTNGQEFDIRLSSSDQVVNIGDTRFCFRLKLPTPGTDVPVNGLLDPWMYNLPDVATLFEVQSCTLDNTSLIYTNRVNKNMNIRRAIMSRVKQYDPECDPLQNKIQTAQQTIALSQEMNLLGATDKTATGGLIASQTCVSTLPGEQAGVDVTSLTTIGTSLGNINSRCVDKLNELFCERGVYTATQTGNLIPNEADNLSLTAILNDNKKRLAQSSRQYQRCNQVYGSINTNTPSQSVRAKAVERFYPMGNNVADGSIQPDETGNYYSVRLGDLVPELNSFDNFYMNGHTLTLRFKINQQSECLSQIAKPIAANTYAQGSQLPSNTQLTANSQYDNLDFRTLTTIIPTVCQPYLKMNILHVDGSDKQAYKMIQDKLPIAIKSYNHSQGTITNSGQFFWQESFMTSSLSGVMICFTASTKPTGGNFNLSGVAQNNSAKKIAVINSTDFTKNQYDQSMGRGCQYNHDHFYLPVYQVRVQIKNVIYKSNNPPLSQLTLQQWMAAQDSSKMVLGDGKFYDVDFQSYLANKCVYFIPTGKDYSGVDLRDGALVQTTVVFSQDNSYSAPFNREIANKFQGNVLYCCNGSVRFDRGYTEVV